MSKSGSKALSKSVDSVIKSVESVVSSVVPKNMNIKHVLLAILVGLLLCMLMGNTVEGFGGNFISPSEGYCFNAKNRTGNTQRCKAKADASEYICPNDKSIVVTGPSQDCGNGVSPVKTDNFCMRFSNNIQNQLGDPATSCDTGSGAQGNGDVCDYGVATSVTNCSGLTREKCPGGDGSDERPEGITDEIYNNCSWEDCSNFPTSQTEVNEIFTSPLKSEPLKRWASCVENNPGDKWVAIKAASQANTYPWDESGKWVSGTSTGKSYIDADGNGTVTDLDILKPLIYRSEGNNYTAFSGAGVQLLDDDSILPNETWRVAIDKKIIECGQELGLENAPAITREEALNKGAMVGWNHDKSGLLCLNMNPAIERITTEKRKYNVRAPGCGSPGDQGYCDPDGLECAEGHVKPTEAQRTQHTTTCNLNAVQAGINNINDTVADVNNTIRTSTVDGIQKFSSTLVNLIA
jgi:hypothetical protein